MLGAYEEEFVLGIVDAPAGICIFSRRVIVKVEGTFPEPLCFRRLVVGPEGPFGEAGLDRLRGVIVLEVSVDCVGGMTKGWLFEPIGKAGLKLCCRPCKSVVENDCLNIFGFGGPAWT